MKTIVQTLFVIIFFVVIGWGMGQTGGYALETFFSWRTFFKNLIILLLIIIIIGLLIWAFLI